MDAEQRSVGGYLEPEGGQGLLSGLLVLFVAGALALLRWFRRLRIRWEIRDDIHQAVVTLGCAIFCRRRLKTSL